MSRVAAVSGLFLALLFAAWQFRIEGLLTSGDHTARSIRLTLVVLALNSVTGVVLLLAGAFRPGFERAAWTYPALLALGLLVAATAKDALAAGLPTVFVVWPVTGAMALLWPLAGSAR